MAKRLMMSLVVAACCIASSAPLQAGGRAVVVASATAVPAGVVVTQFAVPVAVPQYAVPVAPQSYVQYGGQVGAATPLEGLEDRIAAKVVRNLQAAGVNSALAAPPSLIAKHCGSCHSGATPKAGLDLTSLAALGETQRLSCIARVLADDASQRMPPAASGAKLTAEEVGRLLQELSQPVKGK
ncbi:MAG: hypothetical protein JSS27_02470 [Planctomycetes bacterium]|nr:hypothetical protein [Planctomycetota bacterium]